LWVLLLFFAMKTELIAKEADAECAFFAESEEEARMIAQFYETEYISYQNGIGVVKTPSMEIEDGLRGTSKAACVELYPEIIYTVELSDAGEQKEQWHLSAVEVESAWSVSQGENVTVAVIDTGIDTGHEDLSHAIADARTVVPSSYYGVGKTFEAEYEGVEDFLGHGTHVAGIIAAADNEIGCIGIAPKSNILSIKALEKSGSKGTGKSSWIASAIQMAIEESVDVINLSIGGTKIEDGLLQEAIQKANEAGIVVVSAAGNITGESQIFYPGAYEETIAVSALCKEGSGVSFDSGYSNYGDWIDISAPGTNIMSTVPGGYRAKTGTSMACPVVSGAAALILSMNPDISGMEVRDLLIASAMDLGDDGKDDQYGYGALNIKNLIEVMKDKIAISEPEAKIPNGSFVGEGTEICITTNIPGAQIVYTLDGTEPDENSSVYPAGGMIFGSETKEVRIIAKTLWGENQLSESKEFCYYFVPDTVQLDKTKGNENSLIPVYGAYIDPVMNVPCRRYKIKTDAGDKLTICVESSTFLPVIKLFDKEDGSAKLLNTKQENEKIIWENTSSKRQTVWVSVMDSETENTAQNREYSLEWNIEKKTIKESETSAEDSETDRIEAPLRELGETMVSTDSDDNKDVSGNTIVSAYVEDEVVMEESSMDETDWLYTMEGEQNPSEEYQDTEKTEKIETEIPFSEESYQENTVKNTKETECRVLFVVVGLVVLAFGIVIYIKKEKR